ncbi:MAG: DUF4286 family protein [Cyclobacteriaceae bacterium]
MIIYNVTVNIDHEIFEEWLAWMKDTHIPDVMATGCFESHKILRLLNESPDVEGLTFAIQYFAPDMKTLNTYAAQHQPALQQEVQKRYGERVVAFRTLLEEV